MNELEKTLATVLKHALEVAEKTGNFVIDQAPDLLKEFYNWHITTDILGIVLSIFIGVVIYLICRRLAKESEDNSVHVFEMFQIIPLIIFCANSYNLVFILVAPKLYLIEYFIH